MPVAGLNAAVSADNKAKAAAAAKSSTGTISGARMAGTTSSAKSTAGQNQGGQAKSSASSGAKSSGTGARGPTGAGGAASNTGAKGPAGAASRGSTQNQAGQTAAGRQGLSGLASSAKAQANKATGPRGPVGGGNRPSNTGAKGPAGAPTRGTILSNPSRAAGLLSPRFTDPGVPGVPGGVKARNQQIMGRLIDVTRGVKNLHAPNSPFTGVRTKTLSTAIAFADHLKNLGLLEDGPMLINSAHRPKAYNDALRARDLRTKGYTNVAKHSTHIDGTGLDTHVPGLSPTQIANEMAAFGGISRVMDYGPRSHVHFEVGTRPPGPTVPVSSSYSLARTLDPTASQKVAQFAAAGKGQPTVGFSRPSITDAVQRSVPSPAPSMPSPNDPRGLLANAPRNKPDDIVSIANDTRNYQNAVQNMRGYENRGLDPTGTSAELAAMDRAIRSYQGYPGTLGAGNTGIPGERIVSAERVAPNMDMSGYNSPMALTGQTRPRSPAAPGIGIPTPNMDMGGYNYNSPMATVNAPDMPTWQRVAPSATGEMGPWDDRGRVPGQAPYTRSRSPAPPGFNAVGGPDPVTGGPVFTGPAPRSRSPFVSGPAPTPDAYSGFEPRGRSVMPSDIGRALAPAFESATAGPWGGLPALSYMGAPPPSGPVDLPASLETGKPPVGTNLPSYPAFESATGEVGPWAPWGNPPSSEPAQEPPGSMVEGGSPIDVPGLPQPGEPYTEGEPMDITNGTIEEINKRQPVLPGEKLPRPIIQEFTKKGLKRGQRIQPVGPWTKRGLMAGLGMIGAPPGLFSAAEYGARKLTDAHYKGMGGWSNPNVKQGIGPFAANQDRPDMQGAGADAGSGRQISGDGPNGQWTGRESPSKVAQMQQNVEQVLRGYYVDVPGQQYPQYTTGYAPAEGTA